MKIGYTRMLISEQIVDPQTDVLQQAGYGKLFSDVASGAKIQRPGLEKAISFCRKGGILMAWGLEHMELSMSHLIGIIQQLEKRFEIPISDQKD